MSSNDTRTPAEIAHEQEKLARRLGDSSVPTLPHVAVEVLKLIDKANSGVKDFAEVIRADQALTGRMLRLSNSAAYAQRGAVTDLQRAIVLLGLERTKAMALGFHLSEAMKDCPHTGTLWAHSLMRAWMAFHIAEKFNRSVTGQAFVIGLMVDAGIGVMPTLVGESYFSATDPTMEPERVLRAERQYFDVTHVDVVTVLTSKMWRFPEALARPIALHHEKMATCNTKEAGSLLRAVAHFVGTCPLCSNSKAQVDGKLGGLARGLFGFKDPELREVLKKAAADFEATREMFGSVIDPSVSVQSILEEANKQLGIEPEAEQEDVDGGVLRFEGNEMCLEFAGKNGNRLEACITDAKGNRLFSITIDPEKQTPEQIREELMLDKYDPAQAEQIMRVIEKLAA